MSKLVVIDMNLTPRWADWLRFRGMPAEHWMNLGQVDATDVEILEWARDNDAFILTHDLDFGTLLALTFAAGPSVIQIRGGAVLPEDIGNLVFQTIVQYMPELNQGYLITLEPPLQRLRMLPIR